MKALRKFLDNAKPKFQEGGKFAKFRSTFGAFETFLFTPNETNKGGVHVRDAVDLKRTMIVVVMALMPAFLFGIWNTGFQHFRALGQEATATFGDIVCYGLATVLPIVVVSYVVGLAIEFASAQMRGHEVNEGFLVSGLIIPLVMPADVPLWAVAVATAFAVIFGKEVFGGTGMNIWNPALIARAFLFFAYPTKMSGESVWYGAEQTVDGFSGATALASAGASGTTGFSIEDAIFGFIPGSIGETSVIAIALGGLLLLITGIASWKTMFSVFAGGIVMGLTFNALAESGSFLDENGVVLKGYEAARNLALLPWYEHLVIGGFCFGAVFMATDPVTSSRTETGKFIYGFLIGAMAIIIRVLNPGYPEGMMLAILLMNTFAPLIDYCIVQRNISKRAKRVKIKA